MSGRRPSELDTVAGPAETDPGLEATQAGTAPGARQSATGDEATLPPPAAAADEATQLDLNRSPTDDTLAAPSSPAVGEEDTMAGPARAAPAPDGAVGLGAEVDRYVVVQRLGAGAMGVVWAAYDPTLDRRVALKVLHPSAEGDSQGQARLLREAQALAKLAHPNVVAVHDTGTYRDQVWLAMEFVQGKTLRDWLAEPKDPRPWPEVLQVLLRAGRGLAAAHAAGMVHRDFKPDNVMVGDDGRVRVMDLGLARSFGAGAEANATPEELAQDADAARGADTAKRRPEGNSASLEAITMAGAMVGTPAYMAPEQIAGEEVDARADQFAFCVTAWEALYGKRPFQGETVTNLFTAICTGDITPPDASARLPAWIQQAMRRGMEVEPSDRHASMNTLLGLLEQGKLRARRRRVGYASVAIVGLLGLAGAGWGLQRAATERQCVASGDEIDEVWPGDDDARRQALAAVFEDSDLSYAAMTWGRVEARLDEHASQWREVRQATCRAERLEGSLSAELAAKADACLWERRAELESYIEVTSEGGPSRVRSALGRAIKLGRLETCGDPGFLEQMPELPSDAASRTAIVEARRELVYAESLVAAGEYERAHAKLERVRARESETPWPRLRADMMRVEADLAEREDRHDESSALSHEAFALSAREGDDIGAARSALDLAFGDGYQGDNLVAGRAWASVASVFASRAGLLDSPMLGAGLEAQLATLDFMAGDFDEAIAHIERSIEIRDEGLGVDHPSSVDAWHNMAIMRASSGDLDRADVAARHALRIQREVYGDEHPEVASHMRTLAQVLEARGDYEEAIELMTAAYENQAAAFGPRSEAAANMLSGLAISSYAGGSGDLDLAESRFRELAAIMEELHGPEHRDVANELSNLALVLMDKGQLEEAEKVYRRVLHIREVAHGKDHPKVATDLSNLANVLIAAGKPAGARPLLERALEIQEAKLGPDHGDVAFVLVAYGRLEVALQRPAAAVERLLRAHEIRKNNEASPYLVADSAYHLGRALRANGQEDEALARAKEASDIYTELGEGFEDRLLEVEQWRDGTEPEGESSPGE